VFAFVDRGLCFCAQIVGGSFVAAQSNFLEDDRAADLRSWRDLKMTGVWLDDWPDSAVLLTTNIVAQFHNASLSG
jgi:hypothetical protein